MYIHIHRESTQLFKVVDFGYMSAFWVICESFYFCYGFNDILNYKNLKIVLEIELSLGVPSNEQKIVK